MSSNIIANIQPAKERLVNLLKEINLMEIKSPEPNPRQWRQFWSGFNAVVHSQTIPEIQKLNLYSCLKGKALQIISGYDIAPENYEVVRRLLNEKYGDHSMVTKLLYNELQSIKRNEREWIGTIETIERVLRQLEDLGESLEHSNIEILIENKLPSWILNKIYKRKKKDIPWSQIRNCQHSSTQFNIKPTITKPEQKQRYNLGGTSALSTIKSNQNFAKTTMKNWDSDCEIYTTLNARLNHLKVLKKCTICLRDSRKGEIYKVKKQCFYCRALHNSALYDKRNSLFLNNITYQRNEEQGIIAPSKKKECSTSLYNSTFKTRSKRTKETLLLCSQLSFISKKLSHQLKLTESESQVTKIAPFGMKEPKLCPTARIRLNMLTTRKEIISLQPNIIDYLTNELQVVETSSEFQIQNLTNYWKKPDVLIGAHYSFKFINLQEIKKLKSGHIGDINKLCKTNFYPKEIVYSANVNINSELEKFWKLEATDIQEPSQADDDDQALKHFKRTIIKQGGRYQVCWPWKDSKQKLSSNYGMLSDGNIKCYLFRRIPFGVISSPFLLAATLNYHLENYGSELAWEIRKNLYVDNVIISANGTEEALYKYEKMKEIFGEASMNIREFLSNDEEFNERIPYCDLNQANQENFLGLIWNHERDIIRVVLKPWIGKNLTKRTILQFIASQYDPLGFLVPTMIN
uniref:DUF1758 domain-containing protein n=1 Tax=Wuchereria bancrofti TaxID=6293 RepID=A0AAF5Q590_WUCBA